MLSSCGACNGFIPPRLTACPHCAPETVTAVAAPGLGGSAVKRLCTALMATASGGLLMTTLMACYGAPYPECEPTRDDMDGDCVPVGEDCDDEDAYVGASECQGGVGDEDCPDACSRRGDDACAVDDSQTCEAICDDLTAQSPDTVDTAILACLTTDLCEESLDACVLDALYPSPTTYTLQVTASGFGSEVEGGTLFVWTELNGETQSPGNGFTIIDGAVNFSFDVTGQVSAAPTVSWILDLDGNSRCDAEGELSGQGVAAWAGAYDAPMWSLAIDPAKDPAACPDPENP